MLIGQSNAAVVKILSMREHKFDKYELESEKDMVRSVTKEHERLEETVIYDYIRNPSAMNIIYVVEGVFYRRAQYLKIAREAKKNNFTVLFACSKPPILKDKLKEKARFDMWQKKCVDNVKLEWKRYLPFLIKNYEPIPFEDEIGLDVWEIFEDKFNEYAEKHADVGQKAEAPIVLN